MGCRTGKQCRERYISHLDPDMKRTPWTTEENNTIRDLFPKFGTKWSKYMTFLPGRSDNAIKNRYHIICKNNFEYCSNNRIVAYKRALSDESSFDSDARTNKEESSVRTNLTNLKKLLEAREKLDREIQELEKRCSVLRRDPSTEQHTLTGAPCPPFKRKLQAKAGQASAVSSDSSDFNCDFEWTDAEQPGSAGEGSSKCVQ